MIRASLLAMAATTTLNGRRCRKAVDPRPQLAGVPGTDHQGAGAVDQLAAQVAVAALAQAELARLAAGGVLAPPAEQAADGGPSERCGIGGVVLVGLDARLPAPAPTAEVGAERALT